ncbi:MAG: sodium/solute symporter [Candidatus Hydrogenedentes bacterium]|nr:sodium/solute symporter [Candidatus Hydrogenedentota bacterium]
MNFPLSRFTPMLALALLAVMQGLSATELHWTELPPLPVAASGHFAVVHENALYVAGGSNFPVSPFQGGKKQWLKNVYRLQEGATSWEDLGVLPTPRAYGGAVSTKNGILLIGGTDGATVFDDVLLIVPEGGAMSVTTLSNRLPQPCAFTQAAVLGNAAFMAGGQSAPTSTAALHTFWRLPLEKPDATWEVLEPWPGPARMLPVVAAQGGAYYLISGADLFAQPNGNPGRKFLSDGYAWTPAKGWRRIADPPNPVLAAGAAAIGQAHIAIVSGDDGKLFDQSPVLGDTHPGFPHDVLGYHTITDTWSHWGTAPLAYVVSQGVNWNGHVVIPGGEDRPGHRGEKVLAAAPAPRTGNFSVADYATLAVYFLALLGIGLFLGKREHTTEAFFLGSRKVPWWAVGMSIFGTSLSAITYLAIPAQAFATDWTYFLSNMAIIVVAPIVVYAYIGRFRAQPITTAYEFLENRFHLSVRIYGSIVFALFQIGRMSIILFLPAIALSTATGLSKYDCIVVMGVVTTFYTVIGGIEAVIWTDVLQSFVLVAGALLGMYFVFHGIEQDLAGALSTAYEAGKFHTFNWSLDLTTTTVWVLVAGQSFAMLYPYTADQTMVQRYLTTATHKEAAKAVWTNAAMTLPMSLLFFGLGSALWVYFKEHPQYLDPGLQNDAILPLFIVEVFPSGLKGIIIAGVFAAAMSSLDSSMNSLSTVFVHDYYRRFRPGITDRHALWVARISTLLLGIFATGCAMYVAKINATALFDSYLKMLGFVGGGLSGVMALGVFVRRANTAGALAGATVSAVVVYAIANYTPINGLIHALFGFVSAVSAGWLTSVLFPAKAQASVAGATGAAIR